jgi:hypothetical protein
MSVSEQQRKLKELLLGSGQAAPITGQYYDALRATQQVRTGAPRALTNAAIRGINNKAGGVRSFAAAGYNYPSGQMVIGASLAGLSPSQDRARQMRALMGLGAADDGGGSWWDAVVEGTKAVVDFGKKACPDRTYDSSSTSEQARHCDRTYPKGVNAEQDKYNRLCRMERGPCGPYAQAWTLQGKAERGLPADWKSISLDDIKKGYADVKRAGATPGISTGTTSARLPATLRNVGIQSRFQQLGPATLGPALDLGRKSNTALLLGGVAAAAAIGYFAFRRKA